MDQELLHEASKAWSPSFPRRSTYGDGPKQTQVTSRQELLSKLTEAAQHGGPGYTSVYSFPRGHSQDENVPEIDTVFFDLDIPSGEGSYHPSHGGTEAEWRRDMSKLLVRARIISRTILDAGLEQHFRVAYSGHKCIHLYIDFEPIPADPGSLTRYKNGIATYADDFIDFLSDEAGVELHRWVDVNSHDLGRLARAPNTPHYGAKHVDWTPYCVAGSIKELATMDPDDYLSVTRQPRPLIDDGRVPSERAHNVLTEHIKAASSSQRKRRETAHKKRDESKVQEYQNSSNDSITVEAVRELLIRNKSCIRAWAERDDAYDHGAASRTMEINIIKELAKHEVPIDVIVDFFSDIPGFDEAFTRELVKDIIARYHPSAFVCRNVVADAPQFCLGDRCHIYQRSDDLELTT